MRFSLVLPHLATSLARIRVKCSHCLSPAPGGPSVEATWEPHEKHGKLTTKSDLPDTVFAFPKRAKNRSRMRAGA
jgi:hypothetical protein